MQSVWGAFQESQVFSPLRSSQKLSDACKFGSDLQPIRSNSQGDNKFPDRYAQIDGSQSAKLFGEPLEFFCSR